MVWCYAYWLEFACKNAFCSNLFLDVDDMLLRLHYVHKKLLKNCCKLSDLTDHKEVFEFPDGGNLLPVRAHGSHWIMYKWKALQNLIVDR